MLYKCTYYVKKLLFFVWSGKLISRKNALVKSILKNSTFSRLHQLSYLIWIKPLAVPQLANGFTTALSHFFLLVPWLRSSCIKYYLSWRVAAKFVARGRLVLCINDAFRVATETHQNKHQFQEIMKWTDFLVFGLWCNRWCRCVGLCSFMPPTGIHREKVHHWHTTIFHDHPSPKVSLDFCFPPASNVNFT